MRRDGPGLTEWEDWTLSIAAGFVVGMVLGLVTAGVITWLTSW